MADIRIKDLPAGVPNVNKRLAMDLTTTESATIKDIVYAGRPSASQAEAEAGTNAEKTMTPLTTKQSIASEIGDTLASAAQGALASTSVQPNDLSLVATSGLYTDLIGRPEIGSDVVFDVVEGATSVSISYVPGTLRSVYRNGVRQTQWTATDGSTVTFPIVTSADIGDDGFCEIIVSIGENVGGSTAFNDGRYFLRTEAGRDVGDVVQYENFGGYPTQFIDTRLIFKRAVASKDHDFDVAIFKDTGNLTGVNGVGCALMVATTVTSPQGFQWNLIAKLQLDSTGAGDSCAAYSQGIKNVDGSLWAHCFELRDNVPNPTTGSLGQEIGMFVLGGDNFGNRHAIDISIGSTDSLEGTNIVSSGIRIGPTTGNPLRAQFTRGIQIKGRFKIGLDLAVTDTTYGNVAVAMREGQRIVWTDTPSGDETSVTHAENPLASIRFVKGLPLQVSGMKVASAGGTVGALSDHLILTVNGGTFAVPLYLFT